MASLFGLKLHNHLMYTDAVFFLIFEIVPNANKYRSEYRHWSEIPLNTDNANRP